MRDDRGRAMPTEHRADELKRMDKDALIALLLEAERQRDVAQHDLDMFRSREPGRYAFWHRHLALAYVRKQNPELHQEASSAACQQIDQQGGKSYQDVVAGLEAACEGLLKHVYPCNAQDPDIGDECPSDHPNECGRCYDVRMARAALGEKNDAT